MDKTPAAERFLEFIEMLIKDEKVKNSGDFALQIGVSSSAITEISQGRNDPGSKVIQNSVIRFGLNTHWLSTGDGIAFIETNSKIDTKPEKKTAMEKAYMSIVSNLIDQLASERAEVKRLTARLDEIEGHKANQS